MMAAQDNNPDALRYDAVVFDLFGTLTADASREPFRVVLREMAAICDADPDAFIEAWYCDSAWMKRATGIFPTPAENVQDVCDRLNLEVDFRQVEQAAALRIAYSRRALTPRPDALGALESLRNAGLRTGLMAVCTGEVPLLWEDTAFAPLFHEALFSCLLGFLKPDPQYYQEMVERLRVHPDRALYVSAGTCDDLAGAVEFGLPAVLLLPPEEESMVLARTDARNFAGPRIRNLQELSAFVGS